jgi:transposase
MAGMRPIREKAYPSDVSDEEWAFVAPYLALLPEGAPQRRHELREVFNALKWPVRAGAPRRMLPHDFPPWQIVHQQALRWIGAGVFEAMIHDLRLLLRDFAGRKRRPSAAILDSRTLRSTPESGARAGWDGAKRRKGSKLHLAVDTLGHLLAAHVTPANEQDRAQVEELAAAIQAATGESGELAYVDQGYTGDEPAAAAAAHGIRLEVVKHPEAKRGFVLLPRRWVSERSFAWATRFRRLAKDYERLPAMLAGLHFLAFACLMVQKAVPLLAAGP